MSLTSINPRIIKCLVLLLLSAVLLSTAAPARAAAGDLLAQGDGDNGLWLGQVLTDPAHPGAAITLVRFRSKSAEAWTDVATVNGRIVSMAARGMQLAVLLENGEWMFVWPDGSAIGQPIPIRGKIRALASDGETLWALAAVTGEILPPKPADDLFARYTATQPTTQSTTVPTTRRAVAPVTAGPERPSPATAPSATTAPAENDRDLANPRWMVFRLAGGAWEPGEQMLAPLDAQATAGAERGRVMVAIKPHGSPFFNGSLALPKVDPHTDPQFSILTGDGPPLFWLADATGTGSISSLMPAASDDGKSNRAVPATPLIAPKGFDAGADRAVAVSTGRVRLLYIKGEKNKRKIFEQTYDLKTLQPIGEPAAMQFLVPQSDSVLQNVFSAVMMASLIFAMFVSFQNRRSVRDLFEKPDAPHPALLSLRLLAGAIDLLPIFVAALVVQSIVPMNADPAVTMQDPRFKLIFLIGAAVYLLHTTLAEVVKGRSIGKMIVGLKVIGLDGNPATRGALVTRNLLRVVDLMLFGLMIFSPFRQRVGDIVAGTLVVSAKPENEADPK